MPVISGGGNSGNPFKNVLISPTSTSVEPLEIALPAGSAAAGQDAIYVHDSGGSTVFGITAGGWMTLIGPTFALSLTDFGLVVKTGLFDPASLGASQWSLGLDATPGATRLQIAAKDTGGTVRTANIALT